MPPLKEDRFAIVLMMLGHISADINQGALSAVLPFLIKYHGYSYAAVTTLIFAANMASAIIQPLFGVLGDRRSRPWLMALGVILAGLGMAGIGVLTTYPLQLVSATLSGVGVAMFHPEGGRLANISAGERKGSGMSIFAVGGNIGFFIGPLLAAGALSLAGMRGTLVFLVPALATATLLLIFNERFETLESGAAHTAKTSALPEHRTKFSLTLVILSLRSVINYGLLAFIPLFFVGVLGQTESLSSMVISVFALMGASATILSGRTAERYGTIVVLMGCMALIAGASGVFAFNRSLVLAVVLTGMLAVGLNLFYPSAVALGMSYLPQHLGMASGLLYGVAVVFGGIAEPALGAVADATSLPLVMILISGVAALGVVLSAILMNVDGERSRC